MSSEEEVHLEDTAQDKDAPQPAVSVTKMTNAQGDSSSEDKEWNVLERYKGRSMETNLLSIQNNAQGPPTS